jgi:hypothetical protein
MPAVKRGKRKPVRKVKPGGYPKQPVIEREREEPDMPPVRRGPRRPGEQTKPTQPYPSRGAGAGPAERPADQRRAVEFKSYTPLDTSKLTNVKVPVDPCGAASENGVVAMNGNTYLAVSIDDGATFKYYDPTTIFPKFAGGLLGDQQIVYVPQIDRFVWCMLHGPVASNGDGAFRIAFASSAGVKAKPKSWVYVDFVASDIEVGGADFDQPHLTYSNRNLIIAVDVVGKGRVVMRIPLGDLVTGGSVGYEYTAPLKISGGTFQFSAPCGGQPDGAYMAGHVDTSKIRVFAWLDGTLTYGFHDVGVWKWSDTNDYSSKTPSGVDWCGRCGSRMSGATWQNGALWFSWMAPKSKSGDTPFFPEPHTRVVVVSSFSFTKISEMQVWNPKYAFGYSALAVNSDLEIGIECAWGGPNDEADVAVGILGDFVLWYRDGSTATVDDPGGSKNGRWGDFTRTHRSNRGSANFDGFGYFTVKDSSGNPLQSPFHVRYGR